MALPDLITGSYAASALAITALTPQQSAFVPTAITAASNEIRRFCMDRDFTQTTYTGEVYPVTLDGFIRLNQVPVNQILSVQSNPSQALTVANSDPSVQTATIQFTVTGDLTDGQTITGITLNWVSNGTASTQAIVFTAGMLISDLATAINAVGSGWGAQADTILGAWPVTQLDGGLIAQGCAAGNPNDALFNVWQNYVTNARFHVDDGAKTGLVWVGQQYQGLGPRWGPNWPEWDDSGIMNPGAVKVSYNAGFATIPPSVQFATVETVKVMLQRMRINPYLVSETAGEYSYDLATQALYALPQYVLQELAQYRLHNA